MDFEKLRDLITKCKTANYQAGLDEGRAEVAKEIRRSFEAELEWYLQECEAESQKPIVERKNIVVQGEPLPPQPPTERRCRNCEWFIPPFPGGYETATKGHCYQRQAEALGDLDHSWCDFWKPREEEKETTWKASTAATCEDCAKFELGDGCKMRIRTLIDESMAVCDEFKPKEEP